jgi:hypothetical protein
LLSSNRIDPSLDGGLVADVVAGKEVDERFTTGALCELERRPALDEIGENRGFLVAKPAEDLGEVGLLVAFSD